MGDAWRSLEAHELTRGDRDTRTLGGFRLIAGFGDIPPAGAICSITALSEGVLVAAEIGASGSLLIRYDRLLEVEASGYGHYQTGGNYAGGGVGLIGIAKGMAIAGALNAATRTYHLDSALRLTGPDLELIFTHNEYTPRQIRRSLSRMFALQASARSAPARAAAQTVETVAPAVPAASSPLDDLERITRLHSAGTITDWEFETARARYIKQLTAESG